MEFRIRLPYSWHPLFPPSISRLLLFWLSSASPLSSALSLLDASVLRCKQKIEAGLYHAESKLLGRTGSRTSDKSSDMYVPTYF